MTRQEIKEIKRLFTLNNCAVTSICGCYVDGEKNIKDRWSEPFLTMEEEDIFKYLEIFRKCFSGGMGKNLITLPIGRGDIRQDFLKLRDSRLMEEAVMDAFYQRIIDTYAYVGNYLILVIHDVYDVPGKVKDGTELQDASEEAYEYILACICPVKLQKPGLGYSSEKNTFTHVERDWLLSPPELAVLYPAFHDRSEDREAALLYARDLQEPDKEFIARLLGCSIEMTDKEERAAFADILQDTLGEADLKEVREINKTLLEYASEHAADPEPWKLGKADIRKILEESGIRDGKIGQLEKAFGAYGATEFHLDNIVNRKSFQVETSIGNICMEPEYADALSIREINGEKCLVMNITGDVTVNGIRIQVREENEE